MECVKLVRASMFIVEAVVVVWRWWYTRILVQVFSHSKFGPGMSVLCSGKESNVGFLWTTRVQGDSLELDLAACWPVWRYLF